jgi:hypothetical protein
LSAQFWGNFSVSGSIERFFLGAWGRQTELGQSSHPGGFPRLLAQCETLDATEITICNAIATAQLLHYDPAKWKIFAEVRRNRRRGCRKPGLVLVNYNALINYNVLVNYKRLLVGLAAVGPVLSTRNIGYKANCHESCKIKNHQWVLPTTVQTKQILFVSKF